MDKLFLELLNMSFTASVVILAVLLLRLVLKKAPTVCTYALWVVVLFRLLCPVSLESALALLPTSDPIPQDIIYQTTPQIDSGFAVVDNVVNPVLPPVANHTTSINPIQIWLAVGQYAWYVGMVVMAVYSVISYLKLRKKLVGAVQLRDNIYLVDYLDTPFVTGLFAPKIYLPSNLDVAEQAYIIAHEQCHIRRFDHVTRLLAFVALTLHWFNPLVWVAFVLSGKDMELSCDEAVMKTLDGDLRTDYAQSLLRLATGRKASKLLTATPLAFGEGETKGRVKNVLRYKKPVVWVMALGVVAVVIALVALGSNPQEVPETPEETFTSVAGVGTELRLEETAYVEVEIQEKTNYAIRCMVTDVLTSQDFPLGAKLNFTCDETLTMETKDGGTFAYDWDEPNMSDSDLAVGDIIRVGYTVYDPYQEGNNYYNHLEADSIVYWGLEEVEDTWEAEILPEETTITMTIEGTAEEIPAIVTHKEGYSIAIPVDEWAEMDDNYWQATLNEDVYFYIFCLDLADIQEVATWCLDVEGDVTDWMGRDSIFISNAGNTHFLTALGASENGYYYGLGHCPDEAMEGFGTRMGYILGTIQLTE